MKLIRCCASSIAASLALALFAAAPALGATHIWIGPANGTWSNAANWSGGKPTSGESGGTIVQFGANSTSTMDIAGLVVDQIDFTGANNTINGSTALTINGSNLLQNIVSDAAGNTLSATLPIAISGAALEATSSAGTLAMAGPVSGAPGLVFAGSGGDFSLTGDNTYAGPTAILAGSLHIATPVGFVITGSAITIGDGAGPGAQLILDQSSDISPETAVTVNSDGIFNFQSNIDTAKSLTINGGHALVGTLTMSGPLVMNGGTITISGLLSAGSLSMTSGTISGSAPGTGVLALAGDVQATSSPSGPATIASGVRLNASPTMTVAPGTAPELQVTGAISEMGGSRGITKAGAGTMLTSANNGYTGTTTVSEGTLLANGSQTGAFSVGRNGTLTGSGTLGATSVAGILAPTVPGLHTGALSFGPTGRLDVTLTSAAADAIPSTIVTGTASIDQNAVLNLVVAPGTTVPTGSSLKLIDNDGTDAIAGQFAGAPANSVLGTVEGVPLTVSYTGGDGNDLSLSAPSASAQSSSISTPAPVAPPHPVTAIGPGPGSTSTFEASAYGVAFGLTAPSVCVRKGTPFSVTLNIQKQAKGKSKARGKTKSDVLVRVTKVVFSIGGKTVMTDRSAPFRVLLPLTRSVASGSTIKLQAEAYLKIRGGKSRSKAITVAVRVC